MEAIRVDEVIEVGTLVRAFSGHDRTLALTNSEAVCEVCGDGEDILSAPEGAFYIKVVKPLSGWVNLCSSFDGLKGSDIDHWIGYPFLVSKSAFYKCNEFGVPSDLVVQLKEQVSKFHPSYNRFEDIE